MLTIVYNSQGFGSADFQFKGLRVPTYIMRTRKKGRFNTDEFSDDRLSLLQPVQVCIVEPFCV